MMYHPVPRSPSLKSAIMESLKDFKVDLKSEKMKVDSVLEKDQAYMTLFT